MMMMMSENQCSYLTN